MKLIDADKLLEVIVKRKRPENGADCSKERYRYMQWLADYWAIKDAPPIDAVEVVRCKECKHWVCNPNTEEWGKCKWISDEQFDVVMNADDFCSYGEEAEK